MLYFTLLIVWRLGLSPPIALKVHLTWSNRLSPQSKLIPSVGISEISRFRIYARPRKIDQEAEALGAANKSPTTRLKKTKRSRENNLSNTTADEADDKSSLEMKSSRAHEENKGTSGDETLSTSEDSSDQVSEVTSTTYVAREDLFS